MDCKIAERLPTMQQLLLMKCANMVKRSEVCPDSTHEEMLNVIQFSHDKGYLYTTKQANTFICGYRIPEISEKWKNTIPQEEKGEIFYVNFLVSEEPNKWVLLRMLREYLKKNTDVKELCYFRRNNDKDFKRIVIRRPS